MWWEITVEGGEIGFGVLFKRLEKRPKTSIDETLRPEVEAEEEAEEEAEVEVKTEKATESKEEAAETHDAHDAHDAHDVKESTESKESKESSEATEIRVKEGEPSRVVEKPVIETVVAIRRVDPSKEDIRGYFECKEEGCLEFGFDNSFSYFRTKIVELNLSVMDV